MPIKLIYHALLEFTAAKVVFRPHSKQLNRLFGLNIKENAVQIHIHIASR